VVLQLHAQLRRVIRLITTLKNIKGFTLIELLVVVAIIGVLTSVVLASLNIAREKGANAAIKQSLNNARSQAEIFYDTNSVYTNLCQTDQMLMTMSFVNKTSGLTGTCNSTATEWAISSPLKTSDGTSKYWCVDVTGSAKEYTSALGNATVCQ